MTFPRLWALQRAWLNTPPAAVTLRRLAAYVGLPATQGRSPSPGRGRGDPGAQSSMESIVAAFGGQVPVLHTRPADPIVEAADL